MDPKISQILFESLLLKNGFSNEEIDPKGFEEVIKEKSLDRNTLYKAHYHYVANKGPINYLSYESISESSIKDEKSTIISSSNKDISKSIIDVIYNNKERVLTGILEECKEEGYEVFSDKAKENAFEMLDFVKNNSKHNWSIYPTENQEIAINCTPEKGKGLLILCDSKGSIAYFKVFDERNTRYRCQNIKDFPFELLKTELSFLNPYDTKKPIDTKIQLKSSYVMSNNEYRIRIA